MEKERSFLNAVAVAVKDTEGNPSSSNQLVIWYAYLGEGEREAYAYVGGVYLVCLNQ